MDIDTDTHRPARLRGHHLYCLRFFRGEGYGEGFVAALREARAAEESAGTEVVAGTDDVCRACHKVTDAGCDVDTAPEWAITTLDELACHLLGVSPGDHFGTGELDGPVADTLAAWREGACSTCDYGDICAPRMKQYTT